MKNNNRFVFVVPCYNAEKTIERMLASVYYQTYDNWLILIRDDLSTDNSINKIEEFSIKNNIPYLIQSSNEEITKEEANNAKIICWKNNEKYWEVKNVLSMTRSEFLNENDILLRLDGDDFLCDLCALQDINFIYEQTGCDCLWTNHRWDHKFYKNISGPIPGGYMVKYSESPLEEIELVKFNNDKNIYEWSKNNWNTSHLKTFRKHLITDVDDRNFRGEDGEYIKRAGDRAIYYPVLHKAKMPVYFPKQTYFYTIDESKPNLYHSDDSIFQKLESDFLSQRGFI